MGSSSEHEVVIGAYSQKDKWTDLRQDRGRNLVIEMNRLRLRISRLAYRPLIIPLQREGNEGEEEKKRSCRRKEGPQMRRKWENNRKEKTVMLYIIYIYI